MTDELEIVRRIKSALTDEPRIHLRSHPVAIAVEPDGAVVLQGELPTIAAKKTALDLAAAVPGVTGIVDRLRVAPSQKMTDGEIRDHLRDALVAEPAIDRYEIRILRGAQFQTCREASADSSGRIDLSVDDGVVTLAGRVDSLSHQRLVGAIAWWVPGTRDVINGLRSGARATGQRRGTRRCRQTGARKGSPRQCRSGPGQRTGRNRDARRCRCKRHGKRHGRDRRVVRAGSRTGKQSIEDRRLGAVLRRPDGKIL